MLIMFGFVVLQAIVGCSKTTAVAPKVSNKVEYPSYTQEFANLIKIQPCEDDNILYQYHARYGKSFNRVDLFCGVEESIQHIATTYDSKYHGNCPVAYCGFAVAKKRYPIEQALLKSIVSLERMVSLKISSENTQFNQSSNNSYAELYKKTTMDAVKFTMSEDVICISTLKIENETITYKDDTDLYLQTLLPYNKQALDYKEKFKTSSSIFYSLEKKEESYSILSITETTAQGENINRAFTELIQCKGPNPIYMLETDRYGFMIHEEATGDLGIYSFRKSDVTPNSSPEQTQE